MSTPAGWYPQEDGRQRYWDGAAWTDHFAPGAAGSDAPRVAGATSPQRPAATGATTAQRPWFKKKRVIIPAGLAGVIILGSALGAGGAEPPTAPSALKTPTVHQRLGDAVADDHRRGSGGDCNAHGYANADPDQGGGARDAEARSQAEGQAQASRREGHQRPYLRKVVKDPDSYASNRYIVYGEISQFDAATGTDTFLADVAHKNTSPTGSSR